MPVWFICCWSALASAGGQLAGLGDDSWHRREAATAALAAHPWRGPLLWLGRAHADPEIAARCRRVQQAQRAGLELAPAEYPLLNSLWYDCASRSYVPTAWSAALVPYFAAAMACPDPAFDAASWPRYRQATRDWLRDSPAGALPGWLLAPPLAEMRRRDAVFMSAR
jgi:hypothetical protein